jgi:hypothetical protein
MVSTEYTEPHHPQQNPAQLRAILWIKLNIQIIRTRTSAPDTIWLWIAEYLVDFRNIIADKTLCLETPWSKISVETPGISTYVQLRSMNLYIT